MLAKKINSYLSEEVTRLSELHQISADVFESFAYFVIENHKKKEKTTKEPKVKPLTLAQIKIAVYQFFQVKSTTDLKKSSSFQMATNGTQISSLSSRAGWEELYRKFIDILPGEENKTGSACINGINVFDYFKPWQVFDLDPVSATTEDIKKAYYRLSRIYHPDVPETGDAKIFEALTIMYKSINAKS
jgi:hypothetical protein